MRRRWVLIVRLSQKGAGWCVVFLFRMQHECPRVFNQAENGLCPSIDNDSYLVAISGVACAGDFLTPFPPVYHNLPHWDYHCYYLVIRPYTTPLPMHKCRSRLQRRWSGRRSCTSASWQNKQHSTR
jgi:hypothetical protein